LNSQGYENFHFKKSQVFKGAEKEVGWSRKRGEGKRGGGEEPEKINYQCFLKDLNIILFED